MGSTSWLREYECICDVINHTDEPQFKKNNLKKEIKNTLRKTGFLDYKLFPPSFRWNMCASRLRHGYFDNWDGWEFRSDWSVTFMGFNGYKLPVKKWMGGQPEHLILLGEQGVGDELLFASAIPDLICQIGHNITFQCTPRLKDVFSRSFRIETRDRQKLGELTEGPVVALADLFMFYRKDKSHFPKKPYVKLNPERVDYWKSVLPNNGKPNIGIAWKARHGDLNVFEMMCEDANYINLQYLQGQRQRKFSVEIPEGVIDTGCDPLVDLDDHLHLIKALDKVVTVTQTVVHECGAVGTECHAIRPLRGTGEVHNSLWYYSLGNTRMWPWDINIYNTVKDYKDEHRRSRD